MSSATISIRLNGADLEVSTGTTIGQLLQLLSALCNLPFQHGVALLNLAEHAIYCSRQLADFILCLQR